MATDPNATKMMVPTAEVGQYERIKQELIDDLLQSKMGPFQQAVLDGLAKGVIAPNALR